MSRREPLQVHRADSRGCLHRDGCRDEAVMLVVLEDKILQDILGDVSHLLGGAGELQGGIRERFVAELFVDLIDVVVVDMHVTTRPNEFAELQSCLVSDHHRQQCVAGDVERNAEEHVAATLEQHA